MLEKHHAPRSLYQAGAGLSADTRPPRHETRSCGGRWRHVGLLSDIGRFSMQKSKHLSAGPGGFMVTRDAALAQKRATSTISVSPPQRQLPIR
ncbi:hypothetical protein GHK61_00195 [Sinorhizobium meliloti]|nr:hypothetical protein [Sinorhizobium meliloti]MQX55012.1 hypothetical protein [Sinorhizobium meliloti]